MNAGAAPVGPRVDTADALLDVRDLTVAFHGRGRPVVANRHVSLRVAPAETLGVVGESGSGKSVLCRAMLRLLPTPPAHVTARSIRFDGTELTRATEAQMRRIRGTAVGMVFQNPMTSLSAVWPIGDQVTEGLRIHRGLSRGEARGRGIELFQRIGIPDAARRYDDYPYQWSGGMLQRAVIA
ncbi:MAG: ABC transporter ATP-binding protein, partial [Burkholderiales bacterium]|nr:ABC transporter ATP-binding protein [Burkholderiales bacterium]